MILFGGLLVLLILGVPIAASMGITSLIYILMNNMSPIVLIQRLFSGIDSAALLAIPFFLLAGELMSTGGIARRIVNLVKGLVGNIHGGMGIVAIIAVMFFGAISGSAIAAAATIGGVMYAGLLRSGYSKEFSATVIAAAAPMDNIIPPSIGFVIYGVLARVSIADLYKVGFPTGIIIGIALIIPTYIIAKKRGYKERAAKIASGEIILEGVQELNEDKDESRVKSILNSLWALGTPFIIVGGVFAGVFTPTESAVVACVYSVFVGVFVYKDMTIKHLPEVCLKAAKSTSTLMIIMASATLFAYLMVYAGIPQAALGLIQDLNGGKFVILLAMNLLLLFAGCFMEAGSIQYITVPVLLPIAVALGIDPIHFGMIICANLSIGMLTPPFGITLFTSGRVFNASIQAISKECLPFLAALIVALMIITYFPQTVMWVL